MRTAAISLVFLAAIVSCKAPSARVEDALKRAASWSATVKVVTEQWAQSRLSMRFVRTTLNTAVNNLYRDADSIRSLDPAAAAKIDRIRNAIDPVMAAVAINEPDQARDAAKALTSIVPPQPIALPGATRSTSDR